MTYNYQEQTLLRGIGFNLQRFVGILEHGIVSKNYADELGLTFSKNYSLVFQDNDFISLICLGLVNPEDKGGAFAVYAQNGINFIVEGLPFENDPSKVYLHRLDEVLVKNFIPLENIKGIAIKKEYLDMYLFDLNVIPPNITKYKYICDIVYNYIEFLISFDYTPNKEDILEYLREIYLINKALYNNKNKEEEEELISDYHETLKELNEYLSEATFICFSRILGEKATLGKTITYLSQNRLPMYDLPYEKREKGRKFA